MKKLVITPALVLVTVLAGCNTPVQMRTEPFTIPPTLFSLPSESPSVSIPISREEAIKIASQGLPRLVVERADITAEIHGWYWEVTFDNISAKYKELTPYPIKPPPPGLTGPGAETYTGTYQSIVATIEIGGGFPRSIGTRYIPRPGPYISEQQATNTAKQMINNVESSAKPDSSIPSAPSKWTGITSTEAYLQGDFWVVLFWEEGNPEHRWRLMIDGVTGEAQSVSRG
jgi:hypothetical protein